jgi:ABC-type antimicrobial peptide transport system permease subunit
MNGLVADLRHAVVVYRDTPMTTGIAIAALAIAMAFVSAFLAMWNDLALKPPEGFEQSRGLVTVGQSGGYAAADSSTPLTLDIVEGMNEILASLENIAGIASFEQTLHRDEERVSVEAEAVTRSYSELFPRLQLGRRFDEHDHLQAGEPAVILSDRLWREQFEARRDVLGQTVTLTRPFGNVPEGFEVPPELLQSLPKQDYRIVGIMAPQMRGTFVDTTDVWLPYEQVVPFLYGDAESRPQVELSGVISTTGGSSVPTRMRGLARLAAGIEVAVAARELNERFKIEGQAFVQGLNLTGEEMTFDLTKGVVRDISTQREAQRQVRLFLAGTLLLAAVAACNISLFLLARASRRHRELGIRMAVGASTARLARQLASEAGLLMLVATVLGLTLSLWLSVALRELPFLQRADWRTVSPFDWRVLAMLSGFMLLLTLLVSLAPILGLKRMGIKVSSSMVTARAGWGQQLAGTVQIAVTGIVGAVALAFAWHLFHYATADRGFDPTDVLVVDLEPARGGASAPTSQDGLIVERERRREVIAAIPGVENASFATSAPGGAGELRYTIVQREPGRFGEIATVRTDEHYVDVLRLPLLYGANFDPGNPLQILANERYAIEYYGKANAAGEVRNDRTIIGVFRDVPFGHPAETVLPIGVTTWPQRSYPILLVRTKDAPAEFRRKLQRSIDSGDLEFGFSDIHRLEALMARDLQPDRARMFLTGMSAIVVIVLAAFGFYGTQRYLVTAGQREYAIRSAIGAGPNALARLVVGRSLSLVLPGLVIGGTLAFVAVTWLRDGFVAAAVSAESVTLLVLLVILALVTAATFGPTLQARRVAPAALLRED